MTADTVTAPAGVDLTPGAAWFISKAVIELGKVADLWRNTPSGKPSEPVVKALAKLGTHYDPAGPAFYRQDPSGLRVSITLRDGAAVLAVTATAGGGR